MPFLQFGLILGCVWVSGALSDSLYLLDSEEEARLFAMSSKWNNNNEGGLIFSFFFLIMFACLYSAYTFLKFMVMWTLVLLADFILEFRLEYLWPCWLFFGSVYTTFHCHGLVRTPAVCDFIFCALALMMISQPVMRSRLHAVNKNMAFLLFSVNYSHFTFLLLLFFFLSLFVCRLFVLFLFALPSLWTSFV